MAKKYDKKNSTATKPVNLITLVNPNSPISEQYRTVRTNLQFCWVWWCWTSRHHG